VCQFCGSVAHLPGHREKCTADNLRYEDMIIVPGFSSENWANAVGCASSMRGCSECFAGGCRHDQWLILFSRAMKSFYDILNPLAVIPAIQACAGQFRGFCCAGELPCRSNYLLNVALFHLSESHPGALMRLRHFPSLSLSSPGDSSIEKNSRRIERHGALDDVLPMANVARPGNNQRDKQTSDGRPASSLSGGIPLQKKIEQQGRSDMRYGAAAIYRYDLRR